MTLGDIESLAREALALFNAAAYSTPREARDAHGAIRADREPELARFLLAILPVVRLAAELHDYDFCDATMGGGLEARDPALYAKVAALYDAIDTMRERLGKEG